MATRRRPSRRGQAMLEYSMLNWVILVGLVLSCTVRIIPGPKTPQAMSVIDLFMYAYQVHYDSYLYSLSLPF
ncbi:MAG: hypothetical protein ACO1OB_24915 [Archangium sp.]